MPLLPPVAPTAFAVLAGWYAARWTFIVLVALRITSMRLREQQEAFRHPDWLFEVKHDGFRTLVYVQDGHCEFRSRHGHAFS